MAEKEQAPAVTSRSARLKEQQATYLNGDSISVEKGIDLGFGLFSATSALESPDDRNACIACDHPSILFKSRSSPAPHSLSFWPS